MGDDIRFEPIAGTVTGVFHTSVTPRPPERTTWAARIADPFWVLTALIFGYDVEWGDTATGPRPGEAE